MCSCAPGYKCKTHRSKEDDARMDRQASTYGRASVSMRGAAPIMDRPMPHTPREVQALKTLAEDLNAYLAELER